MEITVIVLGDLARSPRMINHVSSLLEAGLHVRLVGYQDSDLPKALKSSKNLKIHTLSSSFLSKFKKLSGKLFIFYAFLRLSCESLQIFYFLLRGFRSHVILIQNPPSMPVLLVAYLSTCITSASVVIDWHNYAWSLLKIAKKSGLVVKVAYFYEQIFGRLADNGFCVSHNMQKDLKSSSIEVSVLYDRPQERFSSGRDMRVFLGVPNEYFLIVSSTSWTIDEDFSIVFEALEQLNQLSCKVFLVITGKGPLKSFYQQMILEKNWKSVRVEMPWLELEDYPALLAQADLGVCLHISSSGLDLPMKVVDMQEAILPALAFKYPTISEFIQEGLNGELFETSTELTEKILVISS
jgi:beta-1,4-mannosyltransferase